MLARLASAWLLLPGLALCLLLNAGSARLRPSVAGGLRQGLSAETALETASLVSLGMRRLAADVGLVRLLLYYGTPEVEELGEHVHEAHDPEHPEHAWGGGRYPELASRALRILDIDPSFSYAGLYAAGALAFNLNRPQEALRVLEYGLSRDPRNIQYQAYAAAIGFHRKGDRDGVIRLLEPALAEPDCPTMIKHMMAYLYLTAGERAKAAALYRDIRDTSRDAGYRAYAERALRSP